MSTDVVDDLSARLSAELATLDWQDRNDILTRIGRQEALMHRAGQERPIWRGPAPVERLLGTDVVVQTDRGERRGRVICYGVVENGAKFERSVVVHVPASGTQHEVPGSVVRLANPDDSERMQNEVEMARRLSEAAYAAARSPRRPVETLRLNRRRGLRDPGLIQQMVDLARRHPAVVAIDEGPSNFKITGSSVPGPRVVTKRVYVFKTQLRVDISGFDVSHPAIHSISDEQARDMHLGKVRGQVIFDTRDDAIAAFEVALDGLA